MYIKLNIQNSLLADILEKAMEWLKVGEKVV